MERVAFLLPAAGEWVRCLLNPSSLTVRRQAGVQQTQAGGRVLADRRRHDDPLIFTGGGRTRYELDLLFDVELAGQPVPEQDVRRLSDPLWRLADDGTAVVRLVWGKHLNVPGVVIAAAQRFDRYLANGTPRRNWMRLVFQRVHDDAGDEGTSAASTSITARAAGRGGTTGGGTGATTPAGSYVMGGRIDLTAAEHLGDAGRWREIAAANDIDDPLGIDRSRVLRLPEGG